MTDNLIGYRNDIENVSELAQVLFRCEAGLLRELDRAITAAGFRTRNEWFRAQVRKALEDAEKRKVLDVLEKLTVEGITDEEIVSMVKGWRARKSHA